MRFGGFVGGDEPPYASASELAHVSPAGGCARSICVGILETVVSVSLGFGNRKSQPGSLKYDQATLLKTMRQKYPLNQGGWALFRVGGGVVNRARGSTGSHSTTANLEVHGNYEPN